MKYKEAVVTLDLSEKEKKPKGERGGDEGETSQVEVSKFIFCQHSKRELALP